MLLHWDYLPQASKPTHQIYYTDTCQPVIVLSLSTNLLERMVKISQLSLSKSNVWPNPALTFDLLLLRWALYQLLY